MAKHYRIAQAFIRMLASNKELQVRIIGTENNPETRSPSRSPRLRS